MKINKNFGKLEANILVYAPISFKTSTGIIINPPDSFYFSKGYYSIIDNKPEPESNCYVVFKDYTINDENKTITLNYLQEMIPIVPEVYTYSKLKLEMNLFQINKSIEFDEFIDTTMLSNEYGYETPLRKFYDQANDLKSNNPYFETYLNLAKDFLNLDDTTVQNILSNSIMEN